MRTLFLLCVALQHTVVCQSTCPDSTQMDACTAPGIPGLPGQHGPPGIDGNTGIDGFTGQKGYPGDVGARGLYGPPGKVGLTGLRGHPGIDGIDGLNGDEGYQGFPGNVGAPGLPGYSGDPGKIGNPGLKGDPGIGEVPQDDIVAFTVARATELSAKRPISVDFTHILSDINGNFDMVNDSFTCSIAGVYLFSFSFASDSTTSPSVNVIRNSTSLLGSHSASAFSVIQTSTNIMVLNLVKGDTIWLRMNTGSSIHCQGKMLCSFTGVLLHAT